jgi:hypothetical protein
VVTICFDCFLAITNSAVVTKGYEFLIAGDAQREQIAESKKLETRAINTGTEGLRQLREGHERVA